MEEEMLKCSVTMWWSDVYHLPCHMIHQSQNSVHHQRLLTSFFVPLHIYISHFPCLVHVNGLQIFALLQTRSFSSWRKDSDNVLAYTVFTFKMKTSHD
jgi:hypothetical protein